MVDSVKVIPYPPPTDEEKLDTIEKLAQYVIRNGDAFEGKIRDKESTNPKFHFLSSDTDFEGFHYYKWKLLCEQRHYTNEIIDAIEQRYKAAVLSTPPGFINLTIQDATLLKEMLTQNTGSKDAIKALRRWILDRAHSCAAIFKLIYEYINEQLNALTEGKFSKILHTIYVINDVLFNGASAGIRGLYTKILDTDVTISVPVFQCLQQFLPKILQAAYKVANNDTEKTKISKMIPLWVSRGFIDASIGDGLSREMVANNVLSIPEMTFSSPYVNPLPPPLVPPPPKPVLVSVPVPVPPIHNSFIPPPPNFQQIQLQHQQMQQPQQQQQQQQLQLNSMLDPTGNLPKWGPPAGGLLLPQPLIPPGIPSTVAAAVSQIHQNLSMQNSVPSIATTLPFHFSQVAPVLDLHQISVGSMVNIVKAALKSGHSQYVPLDSRAIAMAVTFAVPHIEPGRLDARISEFYRKYQQIKDGPEKEEESQCSDHKRRRRSDSHEDREHGRDRDRERDSFGEERHRDRERDRDRNRERDFCGSRDRDRGDRDTDRGRERNRSDYHRTTLYGPTKNSGVIDSSASRIADDNIGHKLLKGLGWQEGSGLGAEGSGRVEPILSSGQQGKTGVGSESEPAGLAGTDFSTYRQQLSSNYHTRIIERERR